MRSLFQRLRIGTKKSEDENNYISLEGSTKNQKARNIQLNREAKYILWKLKHSRESCEQDDLIVPTKTGKMNTASNLEHRMKVIMKNAGLEDVKGDCIFSERHLPPRCMRMEPG